MITKLNDLFILETNNTSYVMKLLPTGHLEHVYYGKKITVNEESVKALTHKENNPLGTSTQYSSTIPNFYLEDYPLEISSLGKGDLREPLIDLTFSDNTKTVDFLYFKDEIYFDTVKYLTLPYAKGDTSIQTLCITFKEDHHDVYLEVYYSVFEDEDTIVRSTKLINKEEPIVIERLLSNQIDFKSSNYRFINFTGDWVNEMNKNDIPLVSGKASIESRGGSSSNRANPFVMLASKKCDEEIGECYGFNLIYSGNHTQICDIDSHNKLRFLSGINPLTFSYVLNKDEIFEAPQSVMTYSDRGFDGLRKNTHGFINNHVLP